MGSACPAGQRYGLRSTEMSVQEAPMNIFKKLRTGARPQQDEEGHAAAWGGGGLLTIVLIVVLLILIF